MKPWLTVSTRLFPPHLLHLVKQRLEGEVSLEITQLGGTEVRIELANLDGDPDPEAVVRRFKRVLTDQAIQYWSGTAADSWGPAAPRVVTLSHPLWDLSYQLRQLGSNVQVMLTIGCEQINWPVLLEALSGVSGATATIESTSPTDRYVVILTPERGGAPDQIVQQVIARLFPVALDV